MSKRKVLKSAVGAMREFKKRTLKRFDPLGTSIGVAGGYVGGQKLSSEDHKRKTLRCGQKYRLKLTDSKTTKAKKLREFNRCRNK